MHDVEFGALSGRDGGVHGVYFTRCSGFLCFDGTCCCFAGLVFV